MQVDSRETMMALVAYMFFPVPMITKDVERSEFVRYHVNQGALLFMANMAFMIVYLIVAVALHYSGSPQWAAVTVIPGERSFDAASWLLSFTWVFPIIMWGAGVRNVCREEMKPLPLIGKYILIR